MMLTKDIVLNVQRDPMVYGDVHFILYDPDKEIGVTNTSIEINGYTTMSDENGNVSLLIPLENQDKSYKIISSVELYNDIIFMPCGENDIIMTK
jgi:hypothetical protein